MACLTKKDVEYLDRCNPYFLGMSGGAQFEKELVKYSVQLSKDHPRRFHALLSAIRRGNKDLATHINFKVEKAKEEERKKREEAEAAQERKRRAQEEKEYWKSKPWDRTLEAIRKVRPHLCGIHFKNGFYVKRLDLKESLSMAYYSLLHLTEGLMVEVSLHTKTLQVLQDIIVGKCQESWTFDYGVLLFPSEEIRDKFIARVLTVN